MRILLADDHDLIRDALSAYLTAEGDAEGLNVSGRQRMLSQRILFFMAETRHDHDPDIYDRLEDTLILFETSHNWLINRPDLSPALRKLYFEQEPISLDAFSAVEYSAMTLGNSSKSTIGHASNFVLSCS